MAVKTEREFYRQRRLTSRKIMVRFWDTA